MARTIHESIAGIDLLVPAVNDFFTIDSTLPNGDPCLILNSAGGNPGGDHRAFAPAPTLSPNMMKNFGAGPFTMTFWMKCPAGGGNLDFSMGVANVSSNGTVNGDYPLKWNIGAFGGPSFNSCQLILSPNAAGTSLNTYSLVTNVGTTAWFFGAFGVDVPGNPGFVFSCAAGQTPPTSLTATANRSAGTGAVNGTPYFFIGRYGDSMPAPAFGLRTIRLAKIAFHDRLLNLTECQTLFYAMTT